MSDDDQYREFNNVILEVFIPLISHMSYLYVNVIKTRKRLKRRRV